MSVGIQIPTNAYCDLRDVVTLLPHRKFESGTNPSVDQCNEIIQSIAAHINSVLRGAGYPTPITELVDIQLLKHYNAKGAAYLIEAIIVRELGNDSQLIPVFKDDYDLFLKNLGDKSIGLVTPIPDTGATPDGYATTQYGMSSEPIMVLRTSDWRNKF